MSSSTLLPRKLHRELVEADQELYREDLRLRALAEKAGVHLGVVERRRDGALEEMDARIDQRMQLARAIPRGMARGQADVEKLRSQRHECEHKWESIIELGRDAVATVQRELARIDRERRALRQNAAWVEYELKAGKIMEASPPEVRGDTLFEVIKEIHPERAGRRGYKKSDNAHRGLQLTLDKTRLEQDEPFEDLPLPDELPIPTSGSPLERHDAPVLFPGQGQLMDANDLMIARTQALLQHRRSARRPLLPRIIIGTSIAYLLILAGIFLGRALAS